MQDLTPFAFSPLGPIAAHLLNFRFGSGKTLSRERLKIRAKIRIEIIYERKFCFLPGPQIIKRVFLKVNN